MTFDEWWQRMRAGMGPSSAASIDFANAAAGLAWDEQQKEIERLHECDAAWRDQDSRIRREVGANDLCAWKLIGGQLCGDSAEAPSHDPRHTGCHPFTPESTLAAVQRAMKERMTALLLIYRLLLHWRHDHGCHAPIMSSTRQQVEACSCELRRVFGEIDSTLSIFAARLTGAKS